MLSTDKKWILKGIPFLFIIGSLTHFLYDLSGQNVIVGLFFPVNESVWEHLKLVLFPVVLWWVLYYVVNGSKYKINKNIWFTSSLISLLVTMILIPMMHYFFTRAFGVESVVVEIIILFISISLGELLAFHYYNYGKGINYVIIILVKIVIIGIFMYFTFNPPDLPIFIDSTTGQYGI